MNIITTYIGLIDGVHIWEVRDAEGNLIGINQKGDESALVPDSVSARQIRLWLIRHSISLSEVETAINSIPDAMQRDSVRVEWEYAPYIERSHPMLLPLAIALGLTESQVDQAFREAILI